MIVPLSEIAELAEFIAEENILRGSVNLNKVVLSEDLLVCPGYYGKYGFTGMLRHVANEFQIFLNLDKLYNIKYARSRFTLAHELGHYFIDHHRKTLKAGFSLSYDKDFNYFSNDPAEKEANYFATNLLMPKERFIASAGKYGIGAEAIRGLADTFKTSLTSTAIQYRNLISRPCSLVFWTKNQNFRNKNYSDSWFSMVRSFSQNFNLNAQVRSEIFEEFNQPRVIETTTISSSLSSLYPDIKFNSHNDVPVKIETMNLKAFGFLSMVYVSE